MDKNTFFAEYKLCEDDLNKANITWDELMRIESEYLTGKWTYLRLFVKRYGRVKQNQALRR